MNAIKKLYKLLLLAIINWKKKETKYMFFKKKIVGIVEWTKEEGDGERRKKVYNIVI